MGILTAVCIILGALLTLVSIVAISLVRLLFPRKSGGQW